MGFVKIYKDQILFHLYLNIIVALFVSFGSYYHIPLASIKDYTIYAIHFLALQLTLFGFIYLISIPKIIFYSVFPLLFISASLFTYWSYTMDITATGSIIQVILETKPDIAIDLISPQLVIYFIIISFALYFILKRYSKLNTNQVKSPLLVLSIICILIFFLDGYRFGKLKLSRRLPYSLVYSIIEYSNQQDIKITPVKNNLTSSLNDINIVFVLGESVRADHLGINGYPRNTTPKLQNNKNIISFSKIHTPLTYTAISVPQILTNISVNEKSNKNIYSIYSILNKLNYKTTWIGNQSPEKSYRHFINENRTINIIDKFRSVLSFKKEKDSSMIPLFKDSFNKSNSQFFTLHMIGSHWYYKNRISENFQVFKPEIKSKYISSNSRIEMINSYDNTILYLDYFLSEIISSIEDSSTKTLLIYLSDHGEILGENGKWLHAQNDISSQNPAMLIWYSNEFLNQFPDLISSLNQNKEKDFTTDFFYHSILDLIKVQNQEIEYDKSIFRKKNATLINLQGF